MKISGMISLFFVLCSLQARAESQWKCGDVPTDQQLRGANGEEIVRLISRDCDAEGLKVNLQAEDYEALRVAMDALDKDSKFIDQYYAAAQNVANLTLWNQQFVSEISRYSGKLEEEIEKFNQWKQRAQKLNSDSADGIRQLAASVRLADNHPLQTIKVVADSSRFRDPKSLAINYLKKVPDVFFTGDRPGEKELFKALGQVSQALELAEKRVKKNSDALVKNATSLNGTMAEETQARLTYSVFKEKARITETLRTHRMQVLQGVYLTTQSDLKTQIQSLKSFNKNFGAKARAIEAEYQRDLTALESALVNADKADPRQSYGMLKATLKAQAAGFEKKESDVLKTVAKKMRGWLAEADEKSGLAMQLKGEILYLESMTALKVESGRK